MSCSALVRPASPMTNALPFGRWLSRKRAVASADVHSASGGIESPLSVSREARSFGEKRELFVRTRKLKPALSRAAMKRSAPGTGTAPFTSTPSMSHIQLTADWRVLMGQVCRFAALGVLVIAQFESIDLASAGSSQAPPVAAPATYTSWLSSLPHRCYRARPCLARSITAPGKLFRRGAGWRWQCCVCHC